MAAKLFFEVVGALIRQDDKILVCQRLAGDRFGSLWEFPGGKVKPGETKPGALVREIQEELGVVIEVGSLVNTFEDEIPSLKIKVFLYNCTITQGSARCLECQDLKWVHLQQIGTLNLAPADRKIYNYLTG